jgi:hypothetical protein
VAIIVSAGERRENRFERARSKRGYRFGQPCKIGHTEHADSAGAPGLHDEPVDEITDITHFLRAHQLVKAFGASSAAHVKNCMDIAATREERRVAAFHVTAHRCKADREHGR